MKTLATSLVVLLLSAYVCTTTAAISAPKAEIAKVTALKSKVKGPQFPDVCPECVDFMGQFINQILNVILNGGVLGSCGALCSAVTNETYFNMACNLLCDYVGIEAFINIVSEEDPDPIYICQLIDVCGHTDGGQVKIVSAQVVPPTGPQGTTFKIQMQYQVINATSVGGINVLVLPPNPEDEPIEGGEFTEGQQPGRYGIEFDLQANPSEGESFAPGAYAVTVAVCAGDCTTVHPWGGVYAQANTKFTITN